MRSCPPRNPRQPNRTDKFQVLLSSFSNVVFPAHRLYSLVEKIYSPVKLWEVLGGVDSGVNSVACNRLAFSLARDLLPGNLLPSQLFRVPKWNSALSSS